MQKTGCPKCGGTLKLTIEEFFNRIPLIFLNENGNPLHKFNFRNFNGLNSIIKIFDPDYGWFEKKVGYYLNGSGHPNSPRCKSRGELAIQEFLIANQLKFIREYKLSNTRLRFDFYLTEEGIMLEFDGPQHYVYNEWFWRGRNDKFLKQQQNDRTKDQWCQDNGIKMIRITEIKDIPTQLNFLINI